MDILVIISISICSFGVICNVLSACVLKRKEMRSVSSQVLIVLAFFDICFLLSYITQLASIVFCGQLNFKYYAGNVVDFVLYVTSSYALTETAYTGSAYTTVLITIDRCFAICYPLQARRYLTTRRTNISLLVILIFSILINLSQWFQVFHNDYDEEYLFEYTTYIWAAISFIVPLVLISIFNFLIWKQIRKMSGIRQEMTMDVANISNNAAKSEMESSITRMVLWVVGAFFVLNTLSFFAHFLPLILPNVSILQVAVVAHLPVAINSSINFIIFMVYGSQFRQQFLKMVHATFGFCAPKLTTIPQ